jgi:hypothetical protein
MNKDSKKPRKKMGRPSTYNQEMADEICERIAAGETLSAMCRCKMNRRKTQHMPSVATVYNWLDANPDFVVRYRRARELQMQSWGDDIIDIADDTTLDTVTKVTPGGREYEAVDQENIQRSRLKVHTRQWLMARVSPRMYGDKVEHEVSGQVAHGHVHVQLDDKERARRLATFLLQAGQGSEGLAVLSGRTSTPTVDPYDDMGDDDD